MYRLCVSDADLLINSKCKLIEISLDKAEHPKWDIQIIYKGNFSTLRTHISQKSQHTHYDRYREACVTKWIEMNKRSVPAKEKEQLEKLNARAEAEAAGLDPGVEMDGDRQGSFHHSIIPHLTS